jgi:plastocyanin
MDALGKSIVKTAPLYLAAVLAASWLTPLAAAEPVINACAESAAGAIPLQNNVQIQYGFIDGVLKYEPACTHLVPGGSVTFTGSGFGGHPLRGGAYTGIGSLQDPASPVPSTGAGTNLTVTFTKQGLFGFFCNFHASGGMSGAILVGSETVFAGNFD